MQGIRLPSRREVPQTAGPVLLGLGLSLLAGVALGTGNPLIGVAIAALAAASLVVRRPLLVAGLGAGLMYLATPTLDLPTQPIRVLWAALGAVIVLVVLNAGRHRLVLERPWYVLFCAPPVIAALFHLQNLSSLRNALYGLVALAATLWLGGTLARSRPAEVRRVLTWFVWVTSALALLAVYQRIVGYWPVIDDLTSADAVGSKAYPERSAAIFGHPIVYAGVAQVAAFAALLLRMRLWPVAFALNLAGVLLSGSRSAWIGAGVMLTAVVLLQLSGRLPGAFRLWRTLAALVLALGAGAVLAPGTADSVSSGVTDRVSGETSSIGVDARSNRIDQAWNAITEPGGPLGRADLGITLFGYGPNAAAIYWARAPQPADRGAPTFDNTYVTWLYDYGIVGLAWLAAGFGLLAWRLNWAGRVLLLGLLWDIWAYVAGAWPVTLLMLGLAVAVGRLPLPGAAGGPAVAPLRLSRPGRGRAARRTPRGPGRTARRRPPAPARAASPTTRS